MLTLLFFLSLLEDCGYLARAAFLFDKPFRRLGLNGKSAVPLLLGFGCSVPAMLAVRTLPEARVRRRTAFFVPFMSCGAKLPIYSVLAAAFFGRQGGLAIAGLYLLGLLLFLLLSALSAPRQSQGSAEGSSGEDASFLLELPEYRLPSLSQARLYHHSAGLRRCVFALRSRPLRLLPERSAGELSVPFRPGFVASLKAARP